jgi:glycolate oxidase iron-sulfur subunit
MGGPERKEPSLTMDFVQCEHCGRCLEVCPTYEALRTETMSARGRWDLIAGVVSGELKPGPRYYESLSLCLNCMACSAMCPKGVDVEHLVREARAGFPRNPVDDLLKRIVFSGVLLNRSVMRGLIRFLAGVRAFLPQGAADLSRHLPLFISDLLNGFAIPRMADASLFKRFPERVPAAMDVDWKGEITYFVGCFNALVDTAPAEAVIRVLAHNGYDLRIPRGQTCCAAPMLFSNDEAMTRRVMGKNLRTLRGEGHVLVSCATCGSMLRKEYPAVAAREGARISDLAAELARRTIDFAQLLAMTREVRPGRIPVRQRATIHDPCDLARGQGVSREIRQILAAVPGLEIVEMDHPDRCCGGGGTYSISHPDLAREIGRLKAQQILKTEASLVVTGCPGCILQIQRVLANEGLDLPVVHPAEVLAFSYGFRNDLAGR